MKESTALTKYDEVLLLNKGFKYEPFGTLWCTSRNGNDWCVDPNLPGEYLMFAAQHKGSLTTFGTMDRETFEELFA